jgi:hypothetical protein
MAKFFGPNEIEEKKKHEKACFDKFQKACEFIFVNVGWYKLNEWLKLYPFSCEECEAVKICQAPDDGYYPYQCAEHWVKFHQEKQQTI